MMDSETFVAQQIEDAAWRVLEEESGGSLEDKLSLAQDAEDGYEVAVLERALEIFDIMFGDL